MRPLRLVRIDDALLEVIREFNPHYFVTDPSRPNWLNQQFIGMWVHYLGCDRVVRQDNKILIIDKSIIQILAKTILASIIMTIFVLYFDLNANSWVNLELLDRVSKLLMIISLAAIVYFILLYALKISPKKIKI